MSDRKLTLFELHFSDGTVQIGPSRLGGEETAGEGVGSDLAVESETDVESAATEDDGSSGVGRVVVALALLAVAAVAVRRLRGGDEELDELEELDDLADEA